MKQSDAIGIAQHTKFSYSSEYIQYISQHLDNGSSAFQRLQLSGLRLLRLHLCHHTAVRHTLRSVIFQFHLCLRELPLTIGLALSLAMGGHCQSDRKCDRALWARPARDMRD